MSDNKTTAEAIRRLAGELEAARTPHESLRVIVAIWEKLCACSADHEH